MKTITITTTLLLKYLVAVEILSSCHDNNQQAANKQYATKCRKVNPGSFVCVDVYVRGCVRAFMFISC